MDLLFVADDAEWVATVRFAVTFPKRHISGNKASLNAVEYNVAVTSRWFPPVLAVLQTLVYLGLLGHDYRAASRFERHFDAGQFILRDFARPLFEPSGFCGAWPHYTFGQTAVFGIDLPAYVGAALLHSLVNWRSACVATFTTPRGQIIVAFFVLPLWFVVGLSIHRLAQRRWRRRATGRFSRTIISFALIPLPFGILALLLSIPGIFVSDGGTVIRLIGTAFWTFWLGCLSAERLQFWPFHIQRELA